MNMQMIKTPVAGKPLFVIDPHTHYRMWHPVHGRVELKFFVDFETKTLIASGVYCFDKSGQVMLDTKGLTIDRIETLNRESIEFTNTGGDKLLGAPLMFTVPDSDEHRVRIFWRVPAGAKGLQWLTAAQTVDGKQPFLFTQFQSIFARTVFPCQDTGLVRFTYTMELDVPEALRGLAGANVHIERRRGTVANRMVERWRMENPIPAYLVAFAVGLIEARDLDHRTTVYAEPSMIDAAVKEFAALPRIMRVAERLFGPYRWGTFCILIMPRAFAWGGMENPHLTNLSPALVAGDGSGVTTVIHELGHFWFGNLVTNATQREFSLNEGPTVWFEYRVGSIVLGGAEANLHLKLLEQEYDRDVRERFLQHPLWTSLAPDMVGVDPDALHSRVAYFKGCLCLLTLEDHIGKKKMNALMRRYIDVFAFKSMTTSQFLDFLARNLPKGTLEQIRIWDWFFDAGIPNGAHVVRSNIADSVGRVAKAGRVPSIPEAKGWSAPTWAFYLGELPRTLSGKQLWRLNQSFGLLDAKNTTTRWAFLLLAVECGYLDEYQVPLTDFLGANGRRMYLLPLYMALAKTSPGLLFGRARFLESRDGYQGPIAEQLEGLLGLTPPDKEVSAA